MNLTDSTRRQSFIEFIPVSIFGSIMGLCALSYAWRRAAAFWHFTNVPAAVIGYLAIAGFIALSICYLLKCLKFWPLVLAEFRSPLTVCFFATFIICLLLLPGQLQENFNKLATIIWCAGALLMILFAWYIVRLWIDHKQEPDNTLPVWVLPIVGTLDIPIIGEHLNLPGIHEISLLAFGIGSVFAIILLIIIFSRLIFQNPLPTAVQPSLLILTGPLALAFTDYHLISGKFDIITSTLFYFNIFLLFILSSKIFLIPISCPFKVTWWAVSFPVSAVTISSLTYAQHKPDAVHQLFAAGLLTVITVIIGYLFLMTLYRVSTKTF